MPVIEIHVIAGYDGAEKSRLCEALTDAALTVVPATPEAVTVLVHEVPAAGYMRGRQSRQPAPARRDPIEIVRSYLSAMEARDLDTARACLGAGFTMQFPGAEPMHMLEDLIAWSKPRYRSVSKTYAGFDLAVQSGRMVVYARGTLQGEWLDGTEFEGIRFIDRFEIEGDEIVLQEVWNDMGEVRGT